MSSTVCANCGLPGSSHVYRHANGKAYCCRGCAERTLCRCRLSIVQGGIGMRLDSGIAAQTRPTQPISHNESNQHMLMATWTDQGDSRQDPRRIA
jgi:hypothetical protein